MASIPRIDDTVNTDTLNDDVYCILQKIQPDWELSNIQFKTFTEGTINTLFGCYANGEKKSMVMFRIFNDGHDYLIDRDAEVENMKRLSESGCAPQVYAFFKNGFCYKYLPGKSLDLDTVLEPKTYRLVAMAFAELHSLHGQAGESTKSVMFPFMKEQVEKFPDVFDEQISSLFPNRILNKKLLLKEAALLEAELESLDLPIVFCHGDPTPQNIILNENEDAVTFVDFEFASYNYQAFDIAFHFCEFAGLEDPDYSRFPSKNYQTEWLRIYAQHWFLKNDKRDATEQDVEVILHQVNQCVPAVHFVAGVVSTAMALPTMANPVLEYAADRFREYFKTKHHLLAG